MPLLSVKSANFVVSHRKKMSSFQYTKLFFHIHIFFVTNPTKTNDHHEFLIRCDLPSFRLIYRWEEVKTLPKP